MFFKNKKSKKDRLPEYFIIFIVIIYFYIPFSYIYKSGDSYKIDINRLDKEIDNIKNKKGVIKGRH